MTALEARQKTNKNANNNEIQKIQNMIVKATNKGEDNIVWSNIQVFDIFNEDMTATNKILNYFKQLGYIIKISNDEWYDHYSYVISW